MGEHTSLLGRRAVMDEFDGTLHDVARGHGRLVLVTGEPGIGKSSVARELARRAGAMQWSVRWGSCVEGSTAYAPWVKLLRSGGPGPARDAAAALDEAHEALEDPADARGARARLFERVTDALHVELAQGPALVVLDDLHWADQPTISLLGAMADATVALPLLLLGTFRDVEVPSGHTLLVLGGAERIELTGLGEHDVGTLLAGVSGVEPVASVVRAVFAHTAGNPFFVSQVGRLLGARGLGARSSGPVPLPAGVREVLQRRLARLSSWCHQALGTAAVIGPTFEVGLLAEALAARRDEVLDGLGEAAVARVVFEVEDEPATWAFAHALFRQTLLDGLGPVARAGAHRAVGEVLEGRSGTLASDLARHFVAANLDADDDRPRRWTLEAGREAIDRLAWEEAEHQFTRALEASTSDLDRSEALLGLGSARLRAGEPDRAAPAFEAAAAIGVAIDRPDVVARAALGSSGGTGSFEVRLFDHRQIALLESAASLLPSQDPLRPFVLARLSVALSFLEPEARRRTLCDEAMAISRASGDRIALATALASHCDAIAGPDHVDQRLAESAELVALALDVGDRRLELLGRRHRLNALLELGRFAEGDREIAAYGRSAELLGDPFYGWYVPLWRGMRALADGRFDDAERYAAEVQKLGTRGGSANAIALHVVLVSELDQTLGRTDRALAVLRQVLDSDPDVLGQNPSAEWAEVYLHVGMVDEARTELTRLRSSVGTLNMDAEWLAAMATTIKVGLDMGDLEIAGRAATRLRPYVDLVAVEGIGGAIRGSIAGLIGRYEAAIGNRDEAIELLKRGIEVEAAAGYVIVNRTRVALERLAGAAPGPVSSSEATLRRDGDVWAVTFASQTVRVRHSKGLGDLAVLLAHPGRAVHVRELEHVDAAVVGPPRGAPAEAVLDRTAVEQYRRRLADLDDDLAEADDDGDLERASRVKIERDFFVDELTRSFGLGGRTRPQAGDADERLRKAVSARIRHSIDRVAEHHDALARHLRSSVRTGVLCTYEPEHPVRWSVE